MKTPKSMITKKISEKLNELSRKLADLDEDKDNHLTESAITEAKADSSNQDSSVNVTKADTADLLDNNYEEEDKNSKDIKRAVSVSNEVLEDEASLGEAEDDNESDRLKPAAFGLNSDSDAAVSDSIEPPTDDETTTESKTGDEDTSLSQQQNHILASLFEKATRAGKAKLAAAQKGTAANKKESSTANVPPTGQLRLAFLGGGSFGTAMSNLAAKNGSDSTLWVRNRRTVKSLQKNRVNKKYLPDFVLDDRLKFEHDLKQAVKDKDIIFVAVPSSAFRETLKKIAPYISGQSIVSLTKGMEKGTFALMSDIITEELPEVNYGMMSGPNLAVEIMQNMPSASVIASDSEPLRLAVQSALHSAFFRVFASDDVRGVELGGALKNIYAIAMGMASAYDVGENTKAMLLTRALAEMSRFGAASGANPLTFLGLSGVGDLYATCSSELSRNYRIGKMLGNGVTLEAAIKKLGQTAEGVNTIQQVHEKASKDGIYMPITHALYAVIYNDQAALGVALNLMESGFRSDVEFVMPHGVSNDELSAQMDDMTSNEN